MRPPILVFAKWAPRRLDVEPLTGHARADRHDYGLSPADAAALETGLTLATRWGGEVTVCTVGPPEADEVLRVGLAAGATDAIRVEHEFGVRSEVAAAELARVAQSHELVLCGDASADRGSATVPGLVAAHLGWAQALGALAVEAAGEPDEGRVVIVHRRLDRGAREVLRLDGPVVVSVEATVARLRRAALGGVLGAADHPVRVLAPQPLLPPARTHVGETRPHRPRPRPVPAPDPAASPLARQLQLTAAAEERTPPRTLRLEPADAARAIVDQLREWGYV